MTHMIPDDRYPNGHSDDAGSLDPSGRETFGEQEQRSVLRDSLRAEHGRYEAPRPRLGHGERDEPC